MKKCICCGKEVKPFRFNTDDNFINPESDMWDSAVVDKISAGYSSEYDGDMFIIAICDECITLHKDRLTIVGNYLGFTSR